jgi:8-oxo-dGTP pyrophosphatase MutT (NUDIX family)
MYFKINTKFVEKCIKTEAKKIRRKPFSSTIMLVTVGKGDPRILFVQMHDGIVTLPGGEIDCKKCNQCIKICDCKFPQHESASEGAIREFHEETGIPLDHVMSIRKNIDSEVKFTYHKFGVKYYVWIVKYDKISRWLPRRGRITRNSEMKYLTYCPLEELQRSLWLHDKTHLPGLGEVWVRGCVFEVMKHLLLY